MSGGSKSKAKFFHNVIQESILFCGEDDNIKVMQFCALPLLHILLGVVNRMFSEMSAKVSIVSEWPKALHLRQENYHGLGFEGNECKRLLESLPVLYDMMTSDDIEVLRPYLRILESFKDVNHLVHEKEVDIRKLHDAIEEFGLAWKDSGVSLTTKVHLIIDHLEDFVRTWGGSRMELFSEQAHEAAHAEFQKIWSKYRVKEVSNPMFINRLHRAVLDFNGSHGF